jgi:hypothetical protein
MNISKRFINTNLLKVVAIAVSFLLIIASIVFTKNYVKADGPIEISTCAELQLIGSDPVEYPENGDYVLANDIDCSDTATWNPNEDEWEDAIVGGTLIPDTLDGVINNGYFGFAPITLDGGSLTSAPGAPEGGYTISNLWIFRKGSDNVGIFNHITDSQITNIQIDNAQIVGRPFTGILSGNITASSTVSDITITDSMVRSYLSVYGGGLVGVIVGSNIFNITISDTNVHGSGNIIGGLAGETKNNSTVSNSNLINVNVDGGYSIGGAFGEVYDSDIDNVHVIGNILGEDLELDEKDTVRWIGGFVGQMDSGTISNSSFSGMVNINQQFDSQDPANVGGFAGFIANASITDSHVLDDSQIDINISKYLYNVGGFTGSAYLSSFDNTSTEISIFIDAELSIGSIGGFAGLGEGVTIENSFAQASAENNLITINVSDGSVGGIGGFVGILDEEWEVEILSSINDSYSSGVIEVINVTEDVEYIGGFVGEMYNSEIERSYSTSDVLAPQGDDVGGFVGYMSESSIQNSYATGNVYGDDEIGGFIGQNDGEIYRSYATGNVYGDTESSEGAGGFSGKNRESIEQSYATGNVIGYEIVGGFTGANGGEIKDSYARGSVTGQYQVGGFAGRMGGTATNTYSIGLVSGVDNVGGYLGYDSSGATIVNSFWDIQTSEQIESDGGVGRTTAQMKSLSNYPQVENQETYFLQNVSGAQSYQYLIWYINEAKGGDIDGMQVSELTLYLNGEPLSWPIGTGIINPGGEHSDWADEFPTSLIDGNTQNKWLDYAFEENGYSYVIIDMGEQVTFDSYSFVTGNDVTGRDPSTWQLLGSNNYDEIGDLGVWNEDWTLLDSREGEMITDMRNVYVHLASGGWDFENVWNILPNKNNGYPHLRWSTLTDTPVVLTPTTSSRSGSIGGFRPVSTPPPTTTPTQTSSVATILNNLVTSGIITQEQLQLILTLLNSNAQITGFMPVRDLQLGMTGDDVQKLQTILININYSIPAGATGFFGTQTQSALANFQRDNNVLPAQGYFGALTRSKMKELNITGLWW